MQTCQVVLRERCAVAVFAHRRFLLGAMATRESGIARLAHAARLAAVCGFLSALMALPVLGQVDRPARVSRANEVTLPALGNGRVSTPSNTANFVSVLCTGFEDSEGWDLNHSICGDEFALGGTCNYPVSHVCLPKVHTASQNCCHDDPNEGTGWYMSSTSRHCSFPGIRDIHPAAGLQHLRFQYDPAGGLPPGCSGFLPDCEQQAITSHDPVPVLSTTRWSYAIAISGTGGSTMIAETGEHTPGGGIFLTSQTKWDSSGSLLINNNLAGLFVQNANARWDANSPNYANYTIVLDTCLDTVTYSYDGVVVWTEAYYGTTTRPPTTDMGIYTTDHQPGYQTIDIDCHCATHVPCTLCGNNLLDAGEECDGIDDAACPGACLPYCMCPPPVCGCEPLPDGSGCTTSCPDPNEICRPTERILDPVSGLNTVTKCDCVNEKECYIELDPNSPSDPPAPVCRGLHCPGTNRPCELTATPNNSDGMCNLTTNQCVGGLNPGAACTTDAECPDKATITYDCCPPGCEPLPDGSGCTGVCPSSCVCVGGPNNGQACPNCLNAECPGGTCQVTSANQCKPTEVLDPVSGGLRIVTKCDCVDVANECYTEYDPFAGQPICLGGDDCPFTHALCPDTAPPTSNQNGTTYACCPKEPPAPEGCDLPLGADDICYQRQLAGDCPEVDGFCRPTQLVYDPQTGEYTAEKCECVSEKECYIDFIQGPGLMLADLSTGTTLGAVDPVGTVDPDWIVSFTPTSGPPPAPAFSIQAHPSWCSSNVANWIDPYNNAVLANDPPDLYGFEIQFTLDFSTQDNFMLDIDVAADNSASVFLNGNLVGSTPGFSCADKVHIVTTTKSFFNDGANFVRILVNNLATPTPTPMGLLVEGGVSGKDKPVCQGRHCPGTNKACELTSTQSIESGMCINGLCVGGLTPGAPCLRCSNNPSLACTSNTNCPPGGTCAPNNAACPDKATIAYDCCSHSCSVQQISGLDTITFWERTNGPSMPFPFGKNSSELKNRLSDPLGTPPGNFDFATPAAGEWYDVFYSDANGVFAPINGQFVTIEGVWDGGFQPPPGGGAFNIARVDLNFFTGPDRYANYLASFDNLGSFSYLAGSEQLAVDNDPTTPPVTWTVMGDTFGAAPDQRLRITVGFPCFCEPLPDGSACINSICPNSTDICKPTQYTQVGIGQPVVTKCDCVNDNQCAIAPGNQGFLVCEGVYCPFAPDMDCPEFPIATVNPFDDTTTYECCPKEHFCPLKNQITPDPCMNHPPDECLTTDSTTTCQPKCVEIIHGPPDPKHPLGKLYPTVSECDCVEDGPCGPISIKNDPGTSDYALSCFGNCPPNTIPSQSCQVLINGAPQGQDTVFVGGGVVSALALGDIVCCDCAGVIDCEDDRFCNGVEAIDPDTGECQAGEPPCAVEFLCDEEHDTCLVAIPTVSQWGLVILTLLLLIGAKVYFGRRRSDALSV